MKKPTKLPIKIIGHIKYFLNKCSRDNISAIAGQSAFFLILSFVPFVMFLIAMAVLLFGDPSRFKPDDNSLLTRRIEYLDESCSKSTHAVWISAIIALWSAGKGMYIITDGILRIYRLPIKGLWVVRRIYAMGYTIVMLILLLISFAFVVLNSMLTFLLSDEVRKLPGVTYTLYALRYVLIIIVLSVAMTFALKMFLYLRLENKQYCRFKVLFPGMLFTNIAWVVLNIGMNIYLSYFGSSLYGQLGAIIYMLMWIYFSMYLLLYGIQIDYIYREAFLRFSFKNLFKPKDKKPKSNDKKKA